MELANRIARIGLALAGLVIGLILAVAIFSDAPPKQDAATTRDGPARSTDATTTGVRDGRPDAVETVTRADADLMIEVRARAEVETVVMNTAFAAHMAILCGGRDNQWLASVRQQLLFDAIAAAERAGPSGNNGEWAPMVGDWFAATFSRAALSALASSQADIRRVCSAKPTDALKQADALVKRAAQPTDWSGVRAK